MLCADWTHRAEFVSQNLNTSCAPGLHGIADFYCQHTATQHVNYGTDLSNNVTISKAEYDFMVRGGDNALLALSAFLSNPPPVTTGSRLTVPRL